MNITYTAATNPKWVDAEHTAIELEVTFDHCGTVPFSCKANDDTAYGTEIYSRAVAGTYGQIADYVAPVVEVVIPTTVTRFQALAALTQANLMGPVEAYMAAESTDWLTKLAWKEALTFQRDSSFVTGISGLLSLSDTDLDNLFIAASQIK